VKNEPNEKDLSEKYGIHTLPTKILIDPDGVIVGRYGEAQTALDKSWKKFFNKRKGW